MAVGPDKFREALSKFASGVTVVTTRDEEGTNHGITVSAFCSVSLDPPLVLICIEKSAGSHYAFHQSGRFVVNVLHEDQAEYSVRFAAPGGEKFNGIEVDVGEGGIPILKGTLATLECSIAEVCEGGDHTIFVGRLDSARVDSGKPLLYFHGTYRTISEE